MIITLALSLSLLAEENGFPTDRETLSQYVVQSCIHQQVTQQGGAPADHVAFCSCMDEQIGANTSDIVYRAIALGSQGAIGEAAQIDDPAAAVTESQRLFALASAEEQAGAAPMLQSSLGICLASGTSE